MSGDLTSIGGMSDLGAMPELPAASTMTARGRSASKGAAGGQRDDVGAVKAARDFESVLLHKVMEEMSKTVHQDGLLDDDMTQQVQGMFWMYLSQDVGAKGGLGLWKQVYQEMARTGAVEGNTAKIAPTGEE